MQLLDNWNKEILRLAIPSIISNVTVPLLGLVDLAVVGHIGNEAYISAIAVGSMIFNVMYWLLGFLRMGTSGMTSQAYGRQDGQECMNILVRTLTIGVVKEKLLSVLLSPVITAVVLLTVMFSMIVGREVFLKHSV